MNKSKDPISYIFRIIRHIVDKCNSQNITECSIKAWGKCLGQKLRGEEISEFNLLISNENVISELINILSITDILQSTIDDINNSINYSQRKLNFSFNNRIIKLEIYSNLKYLSNYNNYYNNYNNYKQPDPEIDFTCDNLCIDLEGNISKIISLNNFNFDNLNWISKCINDALYKKFSIITTIEPTNLEKIIELNIKYNEMINLGFTCIDDPLIPNNYFIFKSYKSITELSTRAESCSCAICHENYENEKDTVLLSCMHDYHINCIHKWIKQNNKTCPMCRVEIDFRPHTKYGNYTIDNIIQNYNPNYYIPDNRIDDIPQYD